MTRRGAGGLRSSRLRWLSLIPLFLTMVERASSQVPPVSTSVRGESVARRQWPAPLDRRVTLHARGVALREALDRLAALAHLRFSYSAEQLPLDRAVSPSFDDVAVGEALVELLRGTASQPIIAGEDQIVLAPARPSEQGGGDSARTAVPRTLDRVVVTGSAVGAAQRSLTVALDVLPGSELADRDAGTMAQAMDAVPGMWIWSQSPSSLLTRYGSIRGASSFGVSYPKVYIDGIEVANPLLLTQFDPDNIDRIEVIRGPQGAALYGADAISGVVNILTRHEGVDAGEPRVRVRSVAGLSESEFASGAVLTQSHKLALRTGSTLRSAGIDVAVGTLGNFYPGASSRNVSAMGSARLIGARSSLTATARFFSDNVGAATNPLIATTLAAEAPQSVQEYTAGATAKLMSGERWTHTFVAGIDGYRLSNVTQQIMPLPSSATDVALRDARGAADRITVRANSVVRLGESEKAASSLTFAAEQSMLRADSPAMNRGGSPGAPTSPDWLRTTGVSAQADIALRRSLYVTGGVRVEQSDAYAGVARYSTLPMIGTAFVRDFGDVELKLRAAYGKGIRAPRTASREGVHGGPGPEAVVTGLAPEEQSGVEAGLDLFVGRSFSFQLTRFDQLAAGLIQAVAIEDTSRHGGYPGQHIMYRFQNVGAITNRGWEMQGSAQRGPLTLTTAVSLVDSRVRRVAFGYHGDLAPGDRMFDVPAQTISLSTSWSARGWFASFTAMRAFDWIDYDRVALATDALNLSGTPRDLIGAQLRNYWRQYDGVTRLRATASRSLRQGIALVFSGDNLLGQQRGEPDNDTILPGRTITAGVRMAF